MIAEQFDFKPFQYPFFHNGKRLATLFCSSLVEAVKMRPLIPKAVVVIVIFYTTVANSRGAVRKIDPVKKMLTAAESPKNVTKKQALFT